MNQNSSPIDWNSRFSTQSAWTNSLRDYLCVQSGVNISSKVLEVGCGTGTILRETSALNECETVGIDFDFSRLRIAKNIKTDQLTACADVYDLPIAGDSFDFVVFHYFLLWITEPIKALQAILRVLRPGGIALAFAEPDYPNRIEYPASFEELGKLQTESLARQGAYVDVGRRLPEFFSKAGFLETQYGIAGFQKPANSLSDDWVSEWQIIVEDLKYIQSNVNFDKFQELDKTSRKNGARVSWVPTFYAYGSKPIIKI